MASLDDMIDTYGRAWRETDASARDALLDQCWAEDAVYADPTAHLTGRAALSAHIAGLQAARPGYVVEITSGAASHGPWVHFAWQMIDPAGQPALKGVDFGRLAPDGRLAEIVGFFLPLPEK